MLATVKPGTMAIAFTVTGNPEPGGSKKAYIVNDRAVVVDANSKVKGWRDQVAAASWAAYQGDLLRGALAVEFTFFQPRPKGHFGTGKNAGVLKDSAPKYPTTRPDVLKLARAAEDALSKVLYADDSQIVEERLLKVYGEPARCEVTVWVLDAVQPVEIPGKIRLEAAA
jgi:Holliday junction resolvase RusA-like endonuclease